MSQERYEIRGKIGQGGVGAVYQAFDTQLNREVAIKRVLAEGGYEDQDEATKHLLKEATALSSVQHPHIVTVYDAGIDADGPYVVMELIHGRTLDEMVERGTLTWDDLREVALQTQEALIAAQDLDLVHRDLKPSNVMVCWLPSGKFQVKIVDFGLAKFSAAPSLQTIDHGDAVFGSIFFMAPEQFERTPLDKRTDMYAMGCLYYYALTGQYPFTGDTAAEVMASHLQHNVPPLSEVRPDIPPWGAEWIMWHIERSMDDRPKDAREALERFLILDKQSTQPVTMTAPVPDPPNTPGSESSKPKFIFPGSEPAEAQPPAEQAPAPEAAPPAQPVAPTPIQPVAPVQPTPAATPEPISLQPTEAPTPTTAPQPIAPPDADLSPHTKAQQISQEPQQAPAQAAPAPQQPATPANPVPATPAAAPVAPATPAAAPAPAAAPPATTPQISLTGSTSQTQPAATQPAPTQPGQVNIGNTGAAAAPTVASAKKGMPAGAKWAIIGMLILVVVVAVIVGSSIMSERGETTRINKLLAEAKVLNDEGKLQDGIELSQEDLEGVLKRTTDMKETDNRALLLKTLAYTKAKGGYDVNEVILDHITSAKTPESIRTEVFKAVMSRRKSVDNIAPLLEFAKSTQEKNSAAAAIEAARASAVDQPADDFIDDFLGLMNDTDSATVRGAAERAAADLIAQSKNKQAFVDPIRGSYETALNDSAKFAMLRLLGATGGDKAAETVGAALKSDDDATKSAALAALGQWADDSQFDTLVEFIEETDNDSLRRKAFDAAYAFLRTNRKRDPEDLGDMWKTFAGAASSQKEKLQIIHGMANQKHEWAIPVLEYFTEDDDDKIVDKAERAKELVERKLREQSGSDDDDE